MTTTPPTTTKTITVSELQSREDYIMEKIRRTGLSPNAARLLTILMVHGAMGAVELAKITGMYRTETYNYLKALADENYIDIVVRSDRNEYHAHSLKDIVDALIVKQQGVIETLRNLKPEIESVQKYVVRKEPDDISISSDGVILSVGSKKAIMNRAHVMLENAGKSVKLLSTRDVMYRLYHEYVLDVITAKKLPSTIKTEQVEAGTIKPSKMTKVSQLKIAPPLSVMIVDDSVALIMFGGYQMSGIYTTNKALVETMLYTFNLVG